MKMAAVYRRKKNYLVHSWSKTTDGLWILRPPCIALPETSSDTELERAIRAALDASQTGVLPPRDPDKVVKPLLDLAGVTTWSTFAKGTAYLEVKAEGERITLVPTRNLEPKEGFVDDLSRQIVLEGSARETLGASVRRLLTQPL
jgi:hypothetical protein